MGSRSRALLAGLVSAVLFTLHYVAAKAILKQVPPESLAASRALSGGAILLALALGRGARLSWSLVRAVAPAGLVGVGLCQICFMRGLQRGGPLEAALATNLIPVGLAAGAWIYDRERLRGRAALGLTVGLAAATLYSFGQLASGRAAEGWAFFWFALNVVFFVLGMLWLRRRALMGSTILCTGIMLVTGGLCLAAVGVLTHAGPLALYEAARTPDLRPLVFFELTLGTAGAWAASTYALKHLAAAEAGFFNHLQVPLGALVVYAGGGQVPWFALPCALGIFVGGHLVRVPQRQAQTNGPSSSSGVK
jgi:drug/metabolite transporter (DMT)-like permease